MADARAALSARRPAVLLCGPFETPGTIGGYARCNELIARSFLDARFGIGRVGITVPGDGSFARRLLVDLWRTRRALRETRAPIFHLTAQYWRGTYREYAQLRMARSAGCRIVYDVRAGSFAECYDEPGHALRRRLLGDAVRSADAITVEGRPYIDWFRERFDRTPVWFPNFVDGRTRDACPRAPLEPPRPGEPFRVVYAGRLVAQKGLEELIAACGRLEERGLRIELTLLGGGAAEYVQELQQLAASRMRPGALILPGMLGHADLLALLARNHVFAFPSYWPGEGHSNAVNEAMQVGLPVVVTRQGFLGDVVTPECGARVAQRDFEDLARALEELLRDWSRLQACGAAARQRVYGEFSDDVALSRLAAVYESLLVPGKA